MGQPKYWNSGLVVSLTLGVFAAVMCSYLEKECNCIYLYSVQVAASLTRRTTDMGPVLLNCLHWFLSLMSRVPELPRNLLRSTLDPVLTRFP